MKPAAISTKPVEWTLTNHGPKGTVPDVIEEMGIISETIRQGRNAPINNGKLNWIFHRLIEINDK